MKIYNPTKQTIDNITRVNGKWFDGILPGETLEIQDPLAIRVLLKHGCINARNRKKTEEKTAAEVKKAKAALKKIEDEAKKEAEKKANESEFNRPGGVNKHGFGPLKPGAEVKEDDEKTALEDDLAVDEVKEDPKE